jgi:hypothetical protein
MPKAVLSANIREAVMQRADHCCEYCQSQDKYSPNAFTIDHILPEDLGGTNEPDNLAYACFLCNRLKSNKTTGFDPIIQSYVPLFNPRIHIWSQHFSWNENFMLVIGLTSTGRSTVAELQLNRPKLIEYRLALLPFGGHPPAYI